MPRYRVSFRNEDPEGHVSRRAAEEAENNRSPLRSLLLCVRFFSPWNRNDARQCRIITGGSAAATTRGPRRSGRSHPSSGFLAHPSRNRLARRNSASSGRFAFRACSYQVRITSRWIKTAEGHTETRSRTEKTENYDVVLRSLRCTPVPPCDAVAVRVFPPDLASWATVRRGASGGWAAGLRRGGCRVRALRSAASGAPAGQGEQAADRQHRRRGQRDVQPGVQVARDEG